MEVGGVGTGPREASWLLSNQTVPPLPTGGGRSEETHVFTRCCGSPLGPDEATEAQSSDGQESGAGWGLRHRTEAAEGQGAATEHGRETVGAPRHLSSPRSLQEPPNLSPCLPVGPTDCVLGPSWSGPVKPKGRPFKLALFKLSVAPTSWRRVRVCQGR